MKMRITVRVRAQLLPFGLFSIEAAGVLGEYARMFFRNYEVSFFYK